MGPEILTARFSGCLHLRHRRFDGNNLHACSHPSLPVSGIITDHHRLACRHPIPQETLVDKPRRRLAINRVLGWRFSRNANVREQIFAEVKQFEHPTVHRLDVCQGEQPFRNTGLIGEQKKKDTLLPQELQRLPDTWQQLHQFRLMEIVHMTNQGAVTVEKNRTRKLSLITLGRLYCCG